MAGSPLIADFDFTNLIISVISSGVYEAENDFYSDWKELFSVNADAIAAGVPPAFLEANIDGVRSGGSIGGNDLGGGQTLSPYFFLNNIDGWRIRAPEENGEVTINGNLFLLDPTKPGFLPSLGGFQQLFRLVISPQSITTETGVSGLTPAESEALLFIQKLLRNRIITNPVGSGVTEVDSPAVSVPEGTLTLFDDDNLSVLYQVPIWENAAGTVPYRGKGIENRPRLE